MNLNNNPTTGQLAALLHKCDDNSAHHVMWVNKSGEVFISPLAGDLSPVGFEKSTPDMCMRYETCQCGNKYVGPSAAEDAGYVNRMFNSLVKEWEWASKIQDVAYIDIF